MSRITKIWHFIRSNFIALLTGAGSMAVLIIVVFGGEAALSSMPLCVGCHSMTYAAEELKKSTHYRGGMGFQTECKECHVPQGVSNFLLAIETHIFDGTRAIYRELIDDYSTKKKFNKHRLRMAHKARMILKGWDSLTCRACHKNSIPAGKAAKKAHKKMETEGATCIDCHQNLVHREVQESDLDASLREGKMVLKAED